MSITANGKLDFLDGLRGWAALFVLLFHVFCDGMPSPAYPTELLRKTIPFNGMVAVSLFFVLSGFALSIGFLQNGLRLQLIKIAAGRYFRLMIPVFATCIVVFLAMKMGLIMSYSARPFPFGLLLRFEPEITGLMSFALFNVFFNYQVAETYAGPLWTMGVELVGSFIVLGSLLVLGRNRWRWIGYGVLIVTFAAANSFYALFVVGSVMADLYASFRLKMHWTLAASLLSFGILLPIFGPLEVWVANISAISLFAAMGFTAFGVSVVSGSTSRWLGHISFPLYLVHGPVMFILGVPMLSWAQGHGDKIFAAQVAVLAASFLAAHAFAPVNNFAVRVSRWVGNYAAEFLKRQVKAPPNQAAFRPVAVSGKRIDR